ncbi:type II secretion system F family protein [Guptibacillus algicola]|uniref:type II secretion system F family protein n=1 Tax=Guptibacillus algicola TaxID=225844 RepID=UPI001CD2B640|nr:type II secretion system F family protein [Alkalihalobacillus algicola]MCA0987537.1 type II secretion system F family protein [Alkalihalobacillus algicola]
MISMLFAISSVVFFMLLFTAVFSTIFQRDIAIESRADVYFGKSEGVEKKTKKPSKGITQTLLRKFWTLSVARLGRMLEKKDHRKLELMIRESGYEKLSPIEFRLIQILASITGGFLALLLIGPNSDGGFSALILALAVSFLFYRYPIFYLAKKKAQRVKLINRELSDFFDMVSLLLEAGVGLEGAITDVCDRMKGPLSAEFKKTLDEMKRGKSRREAFYDMKKRVPSDSFRSVMTSIIQADHLGVGMSRVIMNLTTRLREQRREMAREQAMKAPVKMLIPMILFIFPPIFIVILGPMVVKVFMEGLG